MANNTGTPPLPIKQEQLEEFTRRANGFLAKVEWRPKPGVLPADTSAPGDPNRPSYRESSISMPSAESASLLKTARHVSGDEALLTDDINHTLHAVREGLKLGMYLSKLYTESSGLDRLIEGNRRGSLTDPEKVEFRGKYVTASAITVFVPAYYTVQELSKYKTEDVANIQLEFNGIPELSLQNPVQALQCMLFYYVMYLDTPSVRTDLDFVKMSLLYFRGILDELKLREDSLEYTEAFTNKAYKLEDGDFSLNGFNVDISGAEVSMEFNRFELDKIVGNKEAKHAARRLAERLLCYDFEAKKNPFQELGGFATLRMGYGKPGTGKSLQIAATATMLYDRCQELGYPFLFWPMPDTIVSTFQGGSAERMVNWMRPLSDPTKIIYAPIDDGENNLEDRTRQGVSAGVREVIGVFLRYTEGAYAVNHGNSAIDIFTNLPDQIDKAVLSRVVERFAVDGAETFEDFLDQDYIWWRKYDDVDEAFVDMKDPPDYTYLAAQKLLKNLSSMHAGVLEPETERIKVIYDQVAAQHDITEHAFFATLYQRVLEQFPLFASRDVRNIQKAVGSRVMDFDLPDEWLDNPELFFKKPYSEKKNMLTELMHANMQGLSFAEIRQQETVQYLDNMVRIASVTRDRKIDEMVEDSLLRDEVAERVVAKKAMGG